MFSRNPDLERLRFCLSLRSNPKNKIMVIFCETDEIRKATVRGIYANLLNKESISGLMLVLQSKINSYARKELETYPYKVEIFQLPVMVETDAFARYYGLEKGQVVKITYRGGLLVHSKLTVALSDPFKRFACHFKQ